MVLGIQLRNSEQMELGVSDFSYHGTKIFEFGLKRLCGRVGASVQKVIQDRRFMQPDEFCRRQEGVQLLLRDLAVPRVQFLFRFRNADAVIIARSKHHRKVVGNLELRIFLKKNACSLFLLVMSFAVRFEQQVPAPGQELFVRVAILVHDRGRGLAFLPRVFEVVVLLLEGRSPQLDPYVLHRLGDQLLDMEASRHDLGEGKGLLHCHLHIRGHIHGHLGDGVSRSVRESREHLGNLAGFCALDHRHEGALLSVFGLIRECGPEFTIRQGYLVGAQMGADILRTEHPFLGVFFLIPVLETAQVFFELLLEFLGRQLVDSRNGAERDRLSLCLMLLKNPQMPSLVGCRGNRAGGRVSDTRPGLKLPIASSEGQERALPPQGEIGHRDVVEFFLHDLLVRDRERRQVFFGQGEGHLLLVAPAIRDLKPVKQPLVKNQFENLFGQFHTHVPG